MQDYNEGDVLKLSMEGITHYGLYTGNGFVIHNSKKLRVVKESTLEEFSDGYPISISSGITANNKALAVQTARKEVSWSSL